MKKLILSLSIIVSLFASDKLLSKKETMNVLKATPIYQRLTQDIKKGIVKVRGAKTDDFYVINIITPRGSGNIYVTLNKKYTVLGNVLKKDGQPLTVNFPVNKKTVQKGVLFTFGKGKKEIYLVTDPQCPYCRLMEKDKKEFLNKNYKVHVILFPLPFHRYAKAMSYYILAGKTDAEKAKRLQAILGGSNEWKNFHPTKAQLKQFNKELENSKKAVENLGARGTPTVYNKNFKQIDWTKIGTKK